MNKQYTSQKYPKYDFTTLSNETKYDCNGTGCTCKFLHDRSQYDNQQYLQFKNENSIDYGTNMFQSFKKK